MKCRKKFFGIIAILTASLSLCSCVTTSKEEKSTQAPAAENDFNISILKVGQADAIILKTKNHTAVIDCGEKDDGDEVAEYLTDMGTEKLDYLFITHFDKDHIGGASEVINSFEATEIIMPDYIGTADEYKSFINTLKEKNLTATHLTDKMTFTLDDVLFEVYPPQRSSYKEPDNDYSLVISVTHGENKFLFAGDAERERLTELPTQLALDHDFLKMPHHGNFNKGTTSFLKAVTPEYTVITDSNKNPAENKTIKALETIGSEIYCTKDGNIKIISNGKDISLIQQSKEEKVWQ